MISNMTDAELINAAWDKLKTLPVCPKCKQTASDTIIATHSTGLGDVECVHCQHPYHATKYRKSVFESFDKGWVARTYKELRNYAVFTMNLGD